MVLESNSKAIFIGTLISHNKMFKIVSQDSNLQWLEIGPRYRIIIIIIIIHRNEQDDFQSNCIVIDSLPTRKL